MAEIKRLSGGAKWEDIVGYSRVVKTGNRVIVGGTTAIDGNSKVVGKGDAGDPGTAARRGYFVKRPIAPLSHPCILRENGAS